MTAFSKTLTRLQPGHIVALEGGVEHVIVFVNDCRAVAVPRSAKTVVVRIKPLVGEEKTFSRTVRTGLNISPNSECQIIGLDHEWLAEQKAKAEKKGRST